MDKMSKAELDREERQECPIADSELCNWIGKNGCMPCYVRTLKEDDDKIKALENWQVMLSNLPSDIDSLHESEKCVLCKGEIHDRDCYASVDMAHPEPKHMKGMIFGFGKKIRTPVGSLVTVNMAACSKCRKEFTLMESFTWIFLVGMLVLSLILMMVPALVNSMASVSAVLPALFVVALTVLGYFLGKSISALYRKKISDDMKVDLLEIPLIRNMVDKGWFFFQENKGAPKLFFSRKKTFSRLFCKKEDAQENVEKQS
jgi:uncharacterized membrane protein